MLSIILKFIIENKLFNTKLIKDQKKLQRLHKYFELSSVGDYAIFDMLYFIEKSLTENNLRQSKVTEFFQS